MKLLAATITDATAARRARPKIGQRIPQPVDDTGTTTCWATPSTSGNTVRNTS